MAGSCRLLGNNATRNTDGQGSSYMTLGQTHKPHEQLAQSLLIWGMCLQISICTAQ